MKTAALTADNTCYHALLAPLAGANQPLNHIHLIIFNLAISYQF